MPSDRWQLRGTVLAEDPRTESFFRELLNYLGFDKRKFVFSTAPSGRGSAAAWVLAQYQSEVELLRRKKYQRLCLVAVRDGDNNGLYARKAELDSVCPRQKGERITIAVPTWSIETWLLALLGDDEVDESVTRKPDFERQYTGRERRRALRDAAAAWRDRADEVPCVPSLKDGKAEMLRIDSE